MAFSLNVRLENYEYRALRTGTGQNGPWMSLVLENPDDARQVDVSVPQDLQATVYEHGMSKGDVVTLDVVAYAGQDYSRIRLVEIISIVDKEGQVQL